MRVGHVVLVAAVLSGAAACTPSLPATITPGAPAPGPTGARVVDIPLGTPAGDQGALSTPRPVVIGQLLPYRDEEGLFSLLIPDGWAVTREPPAEAGSDVRVGAVVQPLVGSALITVTQFDNGQAPQGLGQTINSVLKLTGWPDQAGYRELGRENVMGRESEAMRVEIEYERGNGAPMHSLVLFEIDGTTFSMVNAAVESGSWTQNQAPIREILGSYRVPAELPAASPNP